MEYLIDFQYNNDFANDRILSFIKKQLEVDFELNLDALNDCLTSFVDTRIIIKNGKILKEKNIKYYERLMNVFLIATKYNKELEVIEEEDMQYLQFNDSRKKDVYELFCEFQKEDNFYQEMDFEKFDKHLFMNPEYQEKGTFMCLDGDKLVGFISSLVRSFDKDNPKSSGYIHTFIVRKEYRRQGIGSELLKLAEEYLKSMEKTSSRVVFLQVINWPWYIPHTNKHLHPGCPGVIINSDYYLFLYHHHYFVNSIHEGFHLNLCDYELPKKVKDRIEENKKEGLFIELYDEKKHFGVDEFCTIIDNQGFASSIKNNLKREKPYPFVVASLNGKMVGWTGAIYTEASGRGHLDGICVSPEIRGKGLGTGVFAKLCVESKKNDAKYMTFFTGLDNPARYIYLGAGFNVVQSFADMKKNF